MTDRIGRFFLFLGLVLLVIFFASDLARSPRFNLFFFGFVSFIVGVLLVRRGRKPASSSGRFRLLRLLFGKKERKKEPPGEGPSAQG